MKRLLIVLLLAIFSISITGCETEKVKLLYSASYRDTNNFPEVVSYIDNYEDYLLSGYPLELEESFFKNNILYAVSEYINVTASNLHKLSSFELQDKTLKINLVKNMINAGDAFSIYVNIFGINKKLFDKAEKVEVFVDSRVFGRNYYNLEVVNNDGVILSFELKEKYLEGEDIFIRTEVVYNGVLQIYFDGVLVESRESNELGKFAYWDFLLVMPGHNATLEFKIIKDDLKLKDYQLSSITFADGAEEPKNNIFALSNDFYQNQQYLENTYGINENTQYLIIDNKEKYQDIYRIFSGHELNETDNLDQYIWIYVKRTAPETIHIAIEYYFKETSAFSIYPSKHLIGLTVETICYDFIQVNEEMFQTFIDNGAIYREGDFN